MSMCADERVHAASSQLSTPCWDTLGEPQQSDNDHCCEAAEHPLAPESKVLGSDSWYAGARGAHP